MNVTTYSLYQAYLAAERLMKAAQKIDARIAGLELRPGEAHYPTSNPTLFWNYPVHAWLYPEGPDTPERREEVAAAMLAALPEAHLHRENGRIYLHGTLGFAGTPFLLSAGEGVCERVQVGTRIVPAQPEREEPIFEVRCGSDPLAALVGAVA